MAVEPKPVIALLKNSMQQMEFNNDLEIKLCVLGGGLKEFFELLPILGQNMGNHQLLVQI